MHTIKVEFPLELFKEEFAELFLSTIADSLGLTKGKINLKVIDTKITAELNLYGEVKSSTGSPVKSKSDSTTEQTATMTSSKPIKSLDLSKQALNISAEPPSKESQTARETGSEKLHTHGKQSRTARHSAKDSTPKTKEAGNTKKENVKRKGKNTTEDEKPKPKRPKPENSNSSSSKDNTPEHETETKPEKKKRKNRSTCKR